MLRFKVQYAEHETMLRFAVHPDVSRVCCGSTWGNLVVSLVGFDREKIG